MQHPSHFACRSSVAGRKRRFLEALCALSTDPRELVARMIVAFVAFELVLVGMHLVVTDLLGPLAAATADGHIGGFDLDDEATLAVWFSSFQLLLMSMVCLFIAWAGDRAGRNVMPVRMWSSAALIFLVIAVDETAGLHEVAGTLLSGVFASLPIHASWWWSVPYALGVMPVIGYLCVSDRSEPRFALGALAGCLCWLGANTLERVLVAAPAANVALEEGLEMFGATVLLATLSFFFLDVAMGLERAPEPLREATEADAAVAVTASR